MEKITIELDDLKERIVERVAQIIASKMLEESQPYNIPNPRMPDCVMYGCITYPTTYPIYKPYSESYSTSTISNIEKDSANDKNSYSTDNRNK